MHNVVIDVSVSDEKKRKINLLLYGQLFMLWLNFQDNKSALIIIVMKMFETIITTKSIFISNSYKKKDWKKELNWIDKKYKTNEED